MRLVITGASGSLGRQLVPRLQEIGCELLLVGRSPTELKSLFPSHPTIGYDALSTQGQGYDALVHLAIRNNDQTGSLEEFRATNVDFLRTVARAAIAADIPLFINLSTLHASIAPGSSYYAISKAEGEAILADIPELKVVNLRLPAVYGETFTGRLAKLNRLPALLRRPAFHALAALKPTVHISHVASAIVKSAEEGKARNFIVSDRQKRNSVYAWTKRIIDVAIALLLIVFGWWLFICAWIAVRLGSSGPAIFAQERMGQNGKPFVCYKFRTMRQGTRNLGTHEVNSSAITTVGAFLRKTKIDELPQVWNVLRNQMSFVGPRPGLPVQTELTQERKYHGVFDVQPGITGWAQIQNID
jgi:lipopolysaccharide/colanic/teichoic acid biosynthesis glycosyltransferase